MEAVREKPRVKKRKVKHVVKPISEVFKDESLVQVGWNRLEETDLESSTVAESNLLNHGAVALDSNDDALEGSGSAKGSTVTNCIANVSDSGSVATTEGEKNHQKTAVPCNKREEGGEHIVVSADGALAAHTEDTEGVNPLKSVHSDGSTICGSSSAVFEVQSNRNDSELKLLADSTEDTVNDGMVDGVSIVAAAGETNQSDALLMEPNLADIVVAEKESNEAHFYDSMETLPAASTKHIVKIYPDIMVAKAKEEEKVDMLESVIRQVEPESDPGASKSVYPKLDSIFEGATQQQPLSLLPSRQLPARHDDLDMHCEDYLQEFVDQNLTDFSDDSGGVYSPLLDLIRRYLNGLVEVDSASAELVLLETKVDGLSNSVWKISEEELKQSGDCAHGHMAHGVLRYDVAHFQPGEATKLEAALEDSRFLIGDKMSSASCNASSALVLCRAYINHLVSRCANMKWSAVINSQKQAQLSALKNALIVTFYFVRQPTVSKIALDNLKLWTTLMGQALLVHFPTDYWRNQVFLLNHILRCPGGTARWASAHLFWPMALTDSSQFSSISIKELSFDMLTYFWFLFRHVSKRDAFLSVMLQRNLSGVDVDPKEGSASTGWAIVSDDGDLEDSDSLIMVPERDLLVLINQIDVDHMCRVLFGVLETQTIQEVSDTVAFVCQAAGLISQCFYDYGSVVGYGGFVKQAAFLVRTLLCNLSNYWRGARSYMLEKQLASSVALDEIEAEFEICFESLVRQMLLCADVSGVQQCLVDLPFSTLSYPILRKLLYLILTGAKQPTVVMPQHAFSNANNHSKDGGVDLQETNFKAMAAALGDLDEELVVYRLSAMGSIGACETSLAEETLQIICATCFGEEPSTDPTGSQSSVVVKTGLNLVSNLCSKYPSLIGTLIKITLGKNASGVASTFLLDIFVLPLPFWKWQPQLEDIALLRRYLFSDPGSIENRISQKILLGLDWAKLEHAVQFEVAMFAVEARCIHCKPMTVAETGGAPSDISPERKKIFTGFDVFVWAILSKACVSAASWSLTDRQRSRLSASLCTRDRCAIFLGLSLGFGDDKMLIDGFADLGLLVADLIKAEKFTQAVFVMEKWVRMEKDKQTLSKCTRFTSYIWELVHAVPSGISSYSPTRKPPRKSSNKSANDRRPMQNDLPVVMFTSMVVNCIDKAEECELEAVLLFWIKVVLACKQDKPVFNWKSDTSLSCVLNGIMLVALQRRVSLLFLQGQIIRELCNIIAIAKTKTEEAKGGGGIGRWIWGGGSDGKRDLNLIPPMVMSMYPWFTFVWLLAENKALQPVQASFEGLMRRERILNLDTALKQVKIPGDSLSVMPVYRWLCFTTSLASSHPLLPLGLQKLYYYLVRRTRIPAGSDHTEVTYLSFMPRWIRSPYFAKKRPLLEHILAEMTRWHLTVSQRLGKGHLSEQLADLAQDMLAWLEDPTLASSYRLDVAISYKYKCGDLLTQLLSSESSCEPWLQLLDRNLCISEFARILGSWQKALEEPRRYSSTPEPENISQQFMGSKHERMSQSQDSVQNGSNELLPLPFPMSFLESKTINFGECFRGIISDITWEVKKLDDLITAMADSDMCYADLQRRLYANVETAVKVTLQCKQGYYVQKCSGQRVKQVTVKKCKKNEAVSQELETNRNKYRSQRQNVDKAAEKIADQAAKFKAIIFTQFCFDEGYSGVDKQSEFIITEAVKLYYRLITDFANNAPLAGFSFTRTFLLESIADLGNAFVANNPDQVYPLFHAIISHPRFSSLLVSNFTPAAASPDVLLTVFSELVDHLAELTSGDLASSLLVRFTQGLSSVPGLNTDEVQRKLACISLHGLVECNKMANSETVSQCCTIFLDIFESSLMAISSDASFCIVLSDMLSKSKPPAGLYVGAFNTLNELMSKGKLQLRHASALSLANVFSSFFVEERATSRQPLYAVFGSMLDEFGRLAFNLCNILAPCNQPGDVDDFHLLVNLWWNSVLAVFCPWIDPTVMNLAPGGRAGLFIPFAKECQPSGLKFLDAFVSSVIPSLSTLQADQGYLADELFSKNWQFVVRCLGSDASWVVSSYVTAFSKLPWQTFHPSPLDFQLLLDCVVRKPTLCHRFITEVVVKLPWQSVFERLNDMPVGMADRISELSTAFFQIIVRCGARSENMANCRISYPRLVEQFDRLDWAFVSERAVNDVTEFLATQSEPAWLLDPNSAAAGILSLCKTVAFMNSARNSSAKLSSLVQFQAMAAMQKQVAYCKMLVLLIIRLSCKLNESGQNNPLNSSFQILLSDISIGFHHQSNDGTTGCNRAMVSELIKLWNSKQLPEKDAKTLRDIASAWMKSQTVTPDILFTCIASASSVLHDLTVVLVFVEACIEGFYVLRGPVAYFDDLTPHFCLPEPKLESFYTEAANTDCLLSLALSLQTLRRSKSSLDQERKNGDLLLTVIPRGANERLFPDDKFLVLIAFYTYYLRRQLQFEGVTPEMGTVVKSFLGHLSKIAHGDGGWLSSMWSKTPVYPPAFRLICALLGAFIRQQLSHPKHAFSIRLDSSAQMCNSQLQAYNELKHSKPYQAFGNVIALADIFFKDKQYHFGHAVNLIALLSSAVYQSAYMRIVNECASEFEM